MSIVTFWHVATFNRAINNFYAQISPLFESCAIECSVRLFIVLERTFLQYKIDEGKYLDSSDGTPLRFLYLVDFFRNRNRS